MKVEHITSLEMDCGCDPSDAEDPYRLTTNSGKTFVVCDVHFEVIKNILQAEGVTIQGIEQTPAGQPYWRT